MCSQLQTTQPSSLFSIPIAHIRVLRASSVVERCERHNTRVIDPPVDCDPCWAYLVIRVVLASSGQCTNLENRREGLSEVGGMDTVVE